MKTLYGTVNTAKLFYNKLSNFLTNNLGFTRNAYDMYLMNKDICTTMLHINDLKISHIDEKVVIDTIGAINDRYSEIIPLSISKGEVNNYMGILFDYTTPGEVKIHM